MRSYPAKLESDGIFFRIERNGKWLSLCLSDLTDEEKEERLEQFDKDELIRTIEILCEQLRQMHVIAIHAEELYGEDYTNAFKVIYEEDKRKFEERLERLERGLKE
jgi:hypothetical protein